MRIKHKGTLSKAYFISYMKLIMNTHDCSLESSRQITLERVFGEERNAQYDSGYQNFLDAYNAIKNPPTS